MRILNHDDAGYRDHHKSPVHHGMSDENKMGIILILIALIAFGSYAIFYLAGFASELAS